MELARGIQTMRLASLNRCKGIDWRMEILEPWSGVGVLGVVVRLIVVVSIMVLQTIQQPCIFSSFWCIVRFHLTIGWRIKQFGENHVVAQTSVSF